jgi:DNA invertase Pin-like site-specific DNA recombinase
MKKALILTRISTGKQKTDRQVLELESYCRDHGYTITKIISSVVSGRKTNVRPDLDEILSMAKKKEFDLLIVSEISRISRRPDILQSFIATLRNNGIPILFKNLGLMSLNEDGRESFAVNVIIAVFSELAAEEVRQLSDRVISGLQAAKARGMTLGRPKVKETASSFLKKYQKAVRYLQAGQSLPETAKLCGIAFNTCKKIRLLLNQAT